MIDKLYCSKEWEHDNLWSVSMIMTDRWEWVTKHHCNFPIFFEDISGIILDKDHTRYNEKKDSYPKITEKPLIIKENTTRPLEPSFSAGSADVDAAAIAEPSGNPKDDERRIFAR
jgi:hypothetical protein